MHINTYIHIHKYTNLPQGTSDIDSSYCASSTSVNVLSFHDVVVGLSGNVHKKTVQTLVFMKSGGN